MNNCQNGSCYNTSNNKYFGCPPRMADGRNFTDYRPECYINNLIRQNNSINNSFQHRMFLTQNADKLMKINRDYTSTKNCCGPCHPQTDISKLCNSNQNNVFAPCPNLDKNRPHVQSEMPDMVSEESNDFIPQPSSNYQDSEAVYSETSQVYPESEMNYPSEEMNYPFSGPGFSGGDSAYPPLYPESEES
jgi:hypothetical protein